MSKNIFFIFIFSILIRPQQLETIEHITLKDGLSQSTVTYIFQDSKGFMWFGTANGLNRYDGYGFSVFKSDSRNPSSISNDIINYIFEDHKGILWIATENGLNSFDKNSGAFKRYDTGEAIRFMPVIEDKKLNLWVGSFGSGLLKLNRSDNSFRIFKNDTSVTDNSKDYIWCAVEAGEGNIFLGTYGGLISFNPSTEKFINHPVNKNDGTGTSGRRVFSIFKDNHLYWIGSDSGVLDCYNSLTGRFIYYELNPAAGESGASIYSIVEYDPERLLIGTMGDAIKIFNKTSGKVENHITSLTDNQVYSLYKDRTGIIWAGTYISGLNKIDLSAKKFKQYKLTDKNLESSFVNCLFKDKDGNKWIGTPLGLNKYNEQNGSYSSFKISGKSSSVSSILEADENNLWIGASSGLYKFNKTTGSFKSYNNEAELTSPVRFLLKYGSQLIISTRGKGIKIFDTLKNRQIRDNKFNIKELNDFSAADIRSDNKGGFWFAGNKGVINVSASGEVNQFKHNPEEKNSISSDNVLSLCFDKYGNLWIGTYGGGLNKLDTEGKITWFSEPEGLPNNVIYGILSDDNDNLWLSTNKGVCRFNIKDNSVRSYDLSDGLQGLEFNNGAFFKANDGEMFFGGLEGWNSFYPKRITDNPFPPAVVITSAKTFDIVIRINDDRLPELTYDKNFISFEFVTLDYHNPSKNQYAYMLEGFDKDWIYSGTRRYAGYTNLEPGEYKFLVKGSNNDGVWTTEAASVSFIITPPFWSTWWFYLLSLVMISAIIIALHKYRLRLKLKQIRKIEEVRKRIADDFHDELGHKLTKISLYSEIMQRELSGSLNGHEEYLKKINDAANNLYDDTKDFIWSIDPVKDSLHDLAVYLKDFGDEFFDHTGVSFIVNEIPENFKKLILPMNWKRQLILIFKEAMNNILKHSGSTEVTLIVENNNGVVSISLKDNGKGFREDEMNKSGRGIENMKSRAQKIGGSLQISSLPGNGIEMTFSGNINQFQERKIQ